MDLLHIAASVLDAYSRDYDRIPTAGWTEIDYTIIPTPEGMALGAKVSFPMHVFVPAVAS